MYVLIETRVNLGPIARKYYCSSEIKLGPVSLYYFLARA